MATFDPSANAPDPNSGGSRRWLDRGGKFCVAFTTLRDRKRTRGGKEFLLFRGEVIDGQPTGQEGKKFTQRVFINEEAWKRLGAMCLAMGLSEPFDLSSDQEVREAMLLRPFKARFKVESHDGNDYAKIAYSEPRDSMSKGEAERCDEWLENARERGLDGWDDADDMGGGERPPPPGDDDIPF